MYKCSTWKTIIAPNFEVTLQKHAALFTTDDNTRCQWIIITMSGLSRQIGWNSRDSTGITSTGRNASLCAPSNLIWMVQVKLHCFEQIHHCNCKNFQWLVTINSGYQTPKCFPHAETKYYMFFPCRDEETNAEKQKINLFQQVTAPFFIRRAGYPWQANTRAIIPRTNIADGCKTWSSAQDDNKVIMAKVFEPNYLSI